MLDVRCPHTFGHVVYIVMTLKNIYDIPLS
uniref:Uncharacterized protein n=1 Tax=Anguilla anguilla TaxID=7936 RepID=A0A0E9RAC6_ANGAN